MASTSRILAEYIDHETPKFLELPLCLLYIAPWNVVISLVKAQEPRRPTQPELIPVSVA